VTGSSALGCCNVLELSAASWCLSPGWKNLLKDEIDLVVDETDLVADETDLVVDGFLRTLLGF
jgi:hypothetical protein